MKPGDEVICGKINMGRYRSGGSWEDRWFTGKVGVLVKEHADFIPKSWEVDVGGVYLDIPVESMERMI